MRHRFHSLCPYFAMFPEHFVRKHLIWSEEGDTVFDPFSGRGTTVFESLCNGRNAAGCDVNPVAVCVSNAKANPPGQAEVLSRIQELQQITLDNPDDYSEWNDDFFRHCFSEATLKQLLGLRKNLKWRSTREDCFIAALSLGSLHGESHRSRRYFSNRMPRTISTKPDYSVRWWKKHGCEPPSRDVFAILREMVEYRFASPPPSLRGKIAEVDARQAFSAFPELEGHVRLIVTSPPYLDTTSYKEDQWLRLWFLGGDMRPTRKGSGDDRHSSEQKYWAFLRDAWAGVSPLLAINSHIVIRIGGSRMDQSGARENLQSSLTAGLGRDVTFIGGLSSEILGSQLRVFQPKAQGSKVEFDFHFAVAA